MTVSFLAEQDLLQFLDALRRHGELHAPLRGSDGALRFGSLPLGVIPEYAALRTLLPPKKYLLKPCEAILTYTPASGYRLPEEQPPATILFGVHPCDLAAIRYLDLLFLGDAPDPLYAVRRSALTLVGISCTPDQFCTCHIQRSPIPASADLFLQFVEDGFIVCVETGRGAELVQGVSGLVAERDMDVPETTRRFFAGTAAANWPPELDPASPLWRELAERCLGCGACSLSCPTCACFDVLEIGGLDGDSAVRLRQWDNCLFRGHGQVAGGRNFRAEREERFRYRYRHKFNGFGWLQGVPACVGCGRCQAVCPVGIDLCRLGEEPGRLQP